MSGQFMNSIRRKMSGATAAADATARLHQLDRELDQEQALNIGAAVLGFIGAVLSLTVNSAFALLPAIAMATLGHYAAQGWSPAVTLLARLGLRSSSEIDSERYAVAAAVSDRNEPRMPAMERVGAD